MKRINLILGVIFLLTLNVNATTWFPAEHTCPICKHMVDIFIIGLPSINMCIGH